MAGEKHIDLAVVSLRDFINTNIATYLRAVETAQSMTTDDLTDPVEVISHRAPFDNRSPLVEVFDEGWSFVNARQRLIAVDCTVAVSYISDANLSGAEQFMRRYVTAVIDTIRSDSTLSSKVIAAIPTDGSSAMARGDTSTTRYLYTQGVEVHVYQG